MFWKIVAVVSFCAGLLLGAVLFGHGDPDTVPAVAPHPPTTLCPQVGGGPVDTSVL